MGIQKLANYLVVQVAGIQFQVLVTREVEVVQLVLILTEHSFLMRTRQFQCGEDMVNRMENLQELAVQVGQFVSNPMPGLLTTEL